LSHFGTLTLAALLLASNAAGAVAQQAPQPGPGKEPPSALTTLLPHQLGRALCYVSRGTPVTYALEDIPARKQQRQLTIRRFLFELKSEKFDDDDTTTPPTPGAAYYGYSLLAVVKGKKARLVATGSCESSDEAGFGCGVECDGGVMEFSPLGNGESLRMRIDPSVHRFRMSWGCGGGGYEVLTDHGETPAVRLERADLKRCAPIEREHAKRERTR
jgi:hypothetical protein